MKLIYRNEWTSAKLILWDDADRRVSRRMKAFPSWKLVS